MDKVNIINAAPEL